MYHWIIIQSIHEPPWPHPEAQEISQHDRMGRAWSYYANSSCICCEINKGVFTANGVEKDLPAHIYMDNVLLLGHSKQQILMKLAPLVEAIFIVIGDLDTLVRQCPLAIDKWSELIVGPVQTMLGLEINTSLLSVSQHDMCKKSWNYWTTPSIKAGNSLLYRKRKSLQASLEISPKVPLGFSTSSLSHLCIDSICPFREQMPPTWIFKRVLRNPHFFENQIVQCTL